MGYSILVVENRVQIFYDLFIIFEILELVFVWERAQPRKKCLGYGSVQCLTCLAD